MKKVMALIVALLFAFAMTSVSFAADKAAADKTAPKVEEKKAPEADKKAPEADKKAEKKAKKVKKAKKAKKAAEKPAE